MDLPPTRSQADRRNRRAGPARRRGRHGRPHRRRRRPGRARSRGRHRGGSTCGASSSPPGFIGVTPLRRPDPLGRRPHAVELARRHQRGDGQLRVRRGPDPPRAPRRHRAHPSRRRGRNRRRPRQGIDWCFESFPGTSTPSTHGTSAASVAAFLGHAAAPVGARRRGAGRQRRRARAMYPHRRGVRRQGRQLLHLAPARPPGCLRAAVPSPLRRWTRSTPSPA